MTTCSFCHQRKGKRSCPALGGTICAPCCGQHRLQAIDCPSTCVYLGGLSIVRDPARAATEFTKADHDAVWDKMRSFSRGMTALRDGALQPFVDAEIDLGDPPEWATSVIIAHAYHGHRDPAGRRLIDHFLAARGRGLSAPEVAAVVAMQRAWASLFEVTSVHTGTGLELRDLLSGETLQVREVTATAALKKGDALFAWLMPISDHLELSGAMFRVPRAGRDRVREAIDAALVDARRRRPGVPDRELVGSLAWAPVRALCEIDDAELPELQTTGGDPLVLCKAHYIATDEVTIRSRLAGVPELEPDGASYTWLEPGTDDRRRVLGSVRLTDGQLVLETMSRERSERGKRLLDAVLGELITHQRDSIQDPMSALGEARARPTRAPDEIPEEIQREVVGKYLQDYYRRWVDEPIPALGGKTPRNAARTRRGRAEVEALLEGIENHSLEMPGGDAIDFAALRRDLGLDPARGDAGEPSDAASYDADRAPDPERWLDMDESLRLIAVEQHHRALAGHPDIPNARLHALMHVIVENQLASGDPAEVRATLDRLCGAGLARHEALHAIGSVMAEAIWAVTQTQTRFDRDATARSLERLQPGAWRFTP